MSSRWQQGPSDPTDVGGWGGKACKCGSISLPRCLGGNGDSVPLYAHWMLCIVPGLACLGALVAGAGVGGFFLALVAMGPLLFATVLVHEVGHLIMAQRKGGQPVKILLWPLGGLAVTANVSSDHCDRIKISAAGPVTHIPMVLFWVLLLFAAEGISGTLAYSRSVNVDNSASMWFTVLFWTMIWINIAMFLFNACVPCFPLDCSSIVMNAMAMRGTPHDQIAKCMVYTSIPIIFLFFAYGFYLFFTAGGGVLWIFIAAWLGYQTFQLYQSTRNHALDRHPLFATVGAASTKPPPIPVATPISTDPYLASFDTAQVCAGTLVALLVIMSQLSTVR